MLLLTLISWINPKHEISIINIKTNSLLASGMMCDWKIDWCFVFFPPNSKLT